MSFTKQVKEEITKNIYNEEQEKILLFCLYKFLGRLVIRNKKYELEIKTENSNVARFILNQTKKHFDLMPKLIIYKKSDLKKNNIFIIQIKEKAEEILKYLNLTTFKEGKIIDFNEVNILNPSKKEALYYLHAMFLISGSVNSPTSPNYHFEINFNDNKDSEFFYDLFFKVGLKFKKIERRSKFVLYLKKAEQIALALVMLGATNSLLEFEEKRIQKDYYNFNNRINICDIYNIMKTMESSDRHINAINKIIETNNEKLLDKKDQKIIAIRIDNPEATLQELSEKYEDIYNEKISKSGINHRLNKYLKISENL